VHLFCFFLNNAHFVEGGKFGLILCGKDDLLKLFWFSHYFNFTATGVTELVPPLNLLLGFCCKQILCPQWYLPLPRWGFWWLWHWASRR